MSSLGSVLKNEITRVARKEIKLHVEPLRKANAAYRREIASLKRQLADLGRQSKALRKAAAKPVLQNVEAESAPRARFSAGSIRSLRDRLGLSREAFGLLVGASGQSVLNWENGVKPRQAVVTSMAALRSIGKREAQARLETLRTAPPRRRRASAT